MQESEIKTISNTSESIIAEALERYDYWKNREEELRHYVPQILDEIHQLELASANDVCISPKDCQQYEAIWAISGSGTIKKPVTETPGDAIYREPGKEWGQGSDHQRLVHAISIITKISLVKSGVSESDQLKLSKEEIKELIRKYSPFLVYNGISEQNSNLQDAIRSGLINFPEEKLHIPAGDILRTIDQVKNLTIPNSKGNEKIGICTHAPHFARAIRMFNKYKPLGNNVIVKAFPIVFPVIENEREFAFSEIMGILGYVSKDQATKDPYPYTK